MARAISDEELQLKKRARRRLIGAVILVTVVVVALPMVLDSEPKPETQDISIRIPSTDAGPFAPKVTAPAKTQAQAEAKAEPRPEPKPEPKQQVASAPAAAKPAPAAKPESRPTPEPKAEKPPAPAPKTVAAKAPATADPGAAKDFVVQVIALSDADKAKQIQQKIAAAGIKAYTEVVATEKGNVTRVRVGPYAGRDAAEKARTQLKGMGLDGTVMSR